MSQKSTTAMFFFFFSCCCFNFKWTPAAEWLAAPDANPSLSCFLLVFSAHLFIFIYEIYTSNFSTGALSFFFECKNSNSTFLFVVVLSHLCFWMHRGCECLLGEVCNIWSLISFFFFYEDCLIQLGSSELYL